jgi:hypothetical protein
MKKIFLIFSILLLGYQGKIETKRYHLDVEIFESDNIIFGQLSDIATDSNNNIYVMDSKDKAIYKFKEDGNIIEKIGRPGQGPGEFITPCSIYINSKDWLYVLDRNQEVEIFDANSKYVKTIKLLEMPTGNRRNIVSDNKDILYVSGYYRNNNTILASYNNSGKIIKYYDLPIIEYGTDIFNSRDIIMINQYLVGCTICYDDEGSIYCSYSWPYILKKITKDKNTISNIPNESAYNWNPFIFKTNQENGKMFGESTYSVKIFFLNKEHLANSVYAIDWAGNPKKVLNISDAKANPDKYFKIKGKFTSLDIFNKDLKRIDTIIINEKVHIYCSDKKGRILGVKHNEEDIQSIVRYKIDFKKEK